MPWFRNATGQLVHYEGELARRAYRRGWAEVDDATAEAEVAALPDRPRRGVPKPLARVKVEHQAKARLTGLEKVRVERAVKDEAPTPRRKQREK